MLPPVTTSSHRWQSGYDIRTVQHAEMALSTGPMGHAKNPTSHRDVNLSRGGAARLIVFASHLLDIVNMRLA